MSTNTYKIAAYAIPLEHSIARKIYENHFNEEYMSFASNALNFDNMSDEDIDAELCGLNAEESVHKAHSDIEHFVYSVELLTDNSNIYQEVSTTFDENENIDHYFGILLGDTSYGDSLNKFQNDIPQEAIDNYNNFVLPILEKYGVKGNPQLVIVQQTS